MTEEINRTLQEMLRWIRASAFPNVQAMLESAMPEEKHRVAYQAIDGSHTINGVKSVAGLGHQAVVELINRCVSMGLMERDDKGRATRSFDLLDFGLITTEQADRALQAHASPGPVKTTTKEKGEQQDP